MHDKLIQLLEKKYSKMPMSLHELEELRFLLKSEKNDINETLSIMKYKKIKKLS